MLDLIQIVDINYCDDLLPLIKVIKTVFNIIQFVIFQIYFSHSKLLEPK